MKVGDKVRVRGEPDVEVGKVVRFYANQGTVLVELSEDKVLGTKFTMSVQTLVALVSVIAAGVGGYYMLLQEIELAKELPEPVSVENIFGDEYPSKPDGHNWPRSYEQYKSQVGGLQQDMDAVYETLDEYEEAIDELEKIVSNLRVEVARKRDK